jgi:hypothetical protein
MSGRLFEENEKIKMGGGSSTKCTKPGSIKTQWGKLAMVWAGEGQGREGGNGGFWAFTIEVEVLPSSCSIGALCSLGPQVEVEVAVAGAGAAGVEVAAGEGAAAEEGVAVEEEAAAEAVTVDGASPFKKGSAIMKGTENICSGVNLAMLAPQSRFDTGHM